MLDEIIADLEVQSMIFDMSIDFETLTLTPKLNYKEPFWLTKWKEKIHGADFDEYIDVDQE